ncbi:hypothetical protein [uncultured Olleya sp.]|uniref:hypothetical protein n=1 Tax=uncultured Olleya sp. TaxID=757243 RepID=UPI0025966F18|nr:hypothetical protein [uncultured Olleya sp.]
MKNLKNLGQALSKAEQQTINGGKKDCSSHDECGSGNCCSKGICYPYGTPGHLCTYFPYI